MVTGNPAPEAGVESKPSLGRIRTPAGIMRPAGLRALTDSERRLAAEVFGAGLDAARVRLLAVPFWDRAFVAGARLIVWPARSALADFAAAPLGLQATFVHELTHVWQAQRGVFLPFAKLRTGDGAAAYAYDLDAGQPFPALNIEQQASIVEHAFLAARGGRTPFTAARYAEIASEWRNL
jgi:hypothetical protein